MDLDPHETPSDQACTSEPSGYEHESTGCPLSGHLRTQQHSETEGRYPDPYPGIDPSGVSPGSGAEPTSSESGHKWSEGTESARQSFWLFVGATTKNDEDHDDRKIGSECPDPSPNRETHVGEIFSIRTIAL
jgi:hypothetical protein